MRYIFIYYNIIYLILLLLIFIYIKKVLNNCYNIENFDDTNSPKNRTNNSEDSTSSPEDDIDKILKRPIVNEKGRKKRKILSVLENNEREKYNVEPENKTNINDIKLYKSEYEDLEKIANELANELKNEF
jgi:hypothetical protein